MAAAGQGEHDARSPGGAPQLVVQQGQQTPGRAALSIAEHHVLLAGAKAQNVHDLRCGGALSRTLGVEKHGILLI